MKKFLYIAIISVGVSALLSHRSNAQTTPEILLTWQAKNYTPPWYAGRSLPIRKTPITAAVEVIDGGRPADLSKLEIRWFVDNRIYKSGIGAKAFPFGTSGLQTGERALKVIIAGYKGGNLEKTAVIPLANQEAVIDSPYPGRTISRGTNAFRALPFFFNISGLQDLSFNWSANGGAANAGASESISLDVSAGEPGASVKLDVRAANRNDQVEFADNSINLTIR